MPLIEPVPTAQLTPLCDPIILFTETGMEDENMSSNMSRVKHIVLVLSGKGGVGKSTVTVQLAHALRQAGNCVGILDIDLCGPSVPTLLGLEGQEVHQCDRGWVPVYTDASMTLGVMSIAFLLNNSTDPVVWRGPKKNAMIKQFITDVYWQDLDYLIIDTPPGTSDEHISVVENIQEFHPDGAILVTTPQGVAIGDVRREISFCRKTGIKILGLIENMSGFVCPTCAECTNIFSSGGGETLANHAKIRFLGRIPIDPKLQPARGESVIAKLTDSQSFQLIKPVYERILHAE